LVAVGPAAIAFVGVLGTWLAHELEYLRVWGWHQFPDAVSRSMHAYFGPIGVVLLVVAVGAVHATLRLVRHLEQRVALLGAALRTTRAPGRVPRRPGPAWTLDFWTVFRVLVIVQLGLYLLQENLEAHAFGLPAPGLGALTGPHALAPFVHFVVAFAMASALWLMRRRTTALVEKARRLEARLARRVAARDSVRPAVTQRSWTPLQRWGTALWARPPPALLR
jgi:hypothetical protein